MVPPPKYKEELRALLKKIFDPGLKWGENQIKSYELMRHYLNSFHLKYLASNQIRDKYIIIDNLQGQAWYRGTGSSVNSIITSLLDQMKVTREESLNSDLTKALNLVMDFRRFRLHCYYYQHVDELVSLQIFITNDDVTLTENGATTTRRNYLAYNVKGNITIIPPEIQGKIGVPELEDLHELTEINESMISASHLMKFFLEIILYYDETETIATLKLSQDEDQIIAQILETFEDANETNDDLRRSVIGLWDDQQYTQERDYGVYDKDYADSGDEDKQSMNDQDVIQVVL